MTGTTDKIKGAVNAAVGTAKQSVGNATGKPKLEAEGIVQKNKGHVQEAVGNAKNAVKRVVDKA